MGNPGFFFFNFLSGTSKRRRKEETTGKNVKKAQHELDHNGLVPLPVKVCFTCNRYLTLPGKLFGVTAPFMGAKVFLEKKKVTNLLSSHFPS